MYDVTFAHLAPPPPHHFLVKAGSPEETIRDAEDRARHSKPPIVLGPLLAVTELSHG
jgi:hypothetical protein